MPRPKKTAQPATIVFAFFNLRFLLFYPPSKRRQGADLRIPPPLYAPPPPASLLFLSPSTATPRPRVTSSERHERLMTPVVFLIVLYAIFSPLISFYSEGWPPSPGGKRSFPPALMSAGNHHQQWVHRTTATDHCSAAVQLFARTLAPPSRKSAIYFYA